MGDSSESGPRAGVTEEQNAAEANVGDSLADAARDEREVAAERVRRELGRDPTDAEVDDFLRRHTEGY